MQEKPLCLHFLDSHSDTAALCDPCTDHFFSLLTFSYYERWPASNPARLARWLLFAKRNEMDLIKVSLKRKGSSSSSRRIFPTALAWRLKKKSPLIALISADCDQTPCYKILPDAKPAWFRRTEE